MSNQVLIALIIVALPVTAWLVEFMIAAFTRKLPSWSDKLSTGAILGSLGLSIWLFISAIAALVFSSGSVIFSKFCDAASVFLTASPSAFFSRRAFSTSFFRSSPSDT